MIDVFVMFSLYFTNFILSSTYNNSNKIINPKILQFTYKVDVKMIMADKIYPQTAKL